MEIKYNRRQIKIGVTLGSILVALTIVSIFVYDSQVRYMTGLGIAYLAIAGYRYYTPYATIKDGFLKKDFGGKILLADITETRRFAGDYIFKSVNKTIAIDRNAVDKSSIDDLETLINDLRDGKYKRTLS